jgi:hypothetical protein
MMVSSKLKPASARKTKRPHRCDASAVYFAEPDRAYRTDAALLSGAKYSAGEDARASFAV